MLGASNLKSESNQPGITTRYYNGAEFNTFAGEQVESKLDFQQFSDRNAPRTINPGVRRNAIIVRWTGPIVTEERGDYQMQAFSRSGIKVLIGENLVLGRLRQNWLHWHDLAKISQSKGQGISITAKWVGAKREWSASRFGSTPFRQSFTYAGKQLQIKFGRFLGESLRPPRHRRLPANSSHNATTSLSRAGIINQWITPYWSSFCMTSLRQIETFM